MTNTTGDENICFISPAFRRSVLAKRNTECLTYSQAWMHGLKWHLKSGDLEGSYQDFGPLTEWAFVQKEGQTDDRSGLPLANPIQWWSPPENILALKTDLTSQPLIVNQAGNKDALDSVLSMAAYAFDRNGREWGPARATLFPEKANLWSHDQEEQVKYAMRAWDKLHHGCGASYSIFLADEKWIHESCQECHWGDVQCHKDFASHPNSLILDLTLHSWFGNRPHDLSPMATFPVGDSQSLTFERCCGIGSAAPPALDFTRADTDPDREDTSWRTPRLWSGASIRAMSFMQLHTMPPGSRSLSQSQDDSYPFVGSRSAPNIRVVLPVIIYKSFDDSVPQWAAQNAVAYVLKDVHDHLAKLRNNNRSQGLDDGTGTTAATEPVFAITSCGQHWQVWIAFQKEAQGDTSLVVAPLLSRPFGMCDFMDRFRLTIVLMKLRKWLDTTYRPSAAQQLDHIWQTWITQHPDRAQEAFLHWFNRQKYKPASQDPQQQPTADLQTTRPPARTPR